MRANEIVSSDRLIEELWPEPPDTAGNALQVYVHKRKALEPERRRGESGELLITRAPGYMLRVEPDQLDAGRFARLLGDGRAAAEAGDPATAARTLAQALELWRGPAYADFAYDPFAQAEIARLEELRLDAVEDRIEADLALGGAAELVGELEALIGDNPLRERLGQLMLALYRAGRQADALEAYDEARRTLDEELGLARARRFSDCRRTSCARRRRSRSRSRWRISRPTLPPLARAVRGRCRARGAKDRDGADRTTTQRERRRSRGAQPRRQALPRPPRTHRRPPRRHDREHPRRRGDGRLRRPRSHEDDAVRAVSAALEIRDAPAQDATVAGAAPRIGVASGEALVSGSGSGPPTFVGEPVTAARELQDAAAAGEILIGEETERLVHGPAAVEAVDTEAGPAWRVRELRHERPAVGSLTAPMVGRGIELGRLRDAFEQVTGERSLRLFTILGTAGIGKSRLAQEFAGEAGDQATVSSGGACRTARASRSGRCARSSASFSRPARRRRERGRTDRRGTPQRDRRRGRLRGTRGDLLGDPKPVHDAGRRAPAGRLRGRPLGGAHVPGPRRVPGGNGRAGADLPGLHRPAGAARAPSGLDSRAAERRLPSSSPSPTRTARR